MSGVLPFLKGVAVGHAPAGLAALEPLLAGLRQIQMVPVEQVAADAARMESSLMKAGMKMNYLAAAAAYDRNDWLMSIEVNRARIDADNASFTTGYASIGRRFGPFTAFVMESAALRDADARQAPDWATPLAGIDAVLDWLRQDPRLQDLDHKESFDDEIPF